jgi:hypothetical protein
MHQGCASHLQHSGSPGQDEREAETVTANKHKWPIATNLESREGVTANSVGEQVRFCRHLGDHRSQVTGSYRDRHVSFNSQASVGEQAIFQ